MPMIDCKFKLNNKPMSVFEYGAAHFPAFSGLGRHANQWGSACLVGEGPIPPGEYYIFDRQSGGRLGELHDWRNGRSNWFALHALDANIDDETYCNKVKRGLFRLHGNGAMGRSEGCIVIENPTDYQSLRAILKSRAPTAVPGSTLVAYGKVRVW